VRESKQAVPRATVEDGRATAAATLSTPRAGCDAPAWSSAFAVQHSWTSLLWPASCSRSSSGGQETPPAARSTPSAKPPAPRSALPQVHPKPMHGTSRPRAASGAKHFRHHRKHNREMDYSSTHRSRVVQEKPLRYSWGKQAFWQRACMACGAPHTLPVMPLRPIPARRDVMGALDRLLLMSSAAEEEVVTPSARPSSTSSVAGLDGGGAPSSSAAAATARDGAGDAAA
jgi:hypothetical protein